ncbi:MAG: glycosyltransferase family 61 protein [Alphaproteobacteria bacterium]|nr:glycosyltransferase family 61 protein [Alphaproteobacteria bacterium]
MHTGFTVPLLTEQTTDDATELVSRDGREDISHYAYPAASFRPHRGFRQDLAAVARGVEPPKRLSAAGYDAPALFFRSVRNAVLFRERGVVTDRDGRVIDATIAAHRHFDPSLSTLTEFSIAADRRVRLSPATEVQQPAVTEPVLFAIHGSYSVYGHFLFEAVSSAYALRSLIRDGKLRMMLPPAREPWPAALLDAVGVPAEAQLQPPYSNIAFDNLIVSSTCSAASTFSPGAVMRDVAQHLTASLPKRRERWRLYLSRLGARTTSLRRLANEAVLYRALQEIGFLAIEPSHYSFRQQMQMFSEAEIVVGLHGSAFANIMFAQPGCIVVDVLPDYWADKGGQWIQNITNLFDQQYFYVVSKSTPVEGGHMIVADVDLILDRVRRALKIA